MKKAKKIVVLLLCAALLVGASVAGTLAYLTSQTQTVKNTFTVGKVALGDQTVNGLDETKVDEYGVALTGSGAGKITTGNTYKLIPGHTYTKDPTIHVLTGSEPCYLFVKVVNGIDDIEAETATGENPYTDIAGQMVANGWIPLSGQENVYYYNTKVDARTAQQDIPVFTNFKLKNDADVSRYASASAVIEVTAYAVQADGFASADAAWTAAPSTWNVTNNP